MFHRSSSAVFVVSGPRERRWNARRGVSPLRCGSSPRAAGYDAHSVHASAVTRHPWVGKRAKGEKGKKQTGYFSDALMQKKYPMNESEEILSPWISLGLRIS